VIRADGKLAYLCRKLFHLGAQQIEQLLISAMKRRPAHLRVYALALLLQLFPSHLIVPSHSGSPGGGRVQRRRGGDTAIAQSLAVFLH
jgi:hypothetical protein